MNLNDLAKEVSKREGGKYNLPIAQISEVQRHVLDILAQESDKSIIQLMNRRRAKMPKTYPKKPKPRPKK